MPTLYDIEEKPLTELVKGASPDAIAVICEQVGSDWFTARCGILTGSNAKFVVTSQGKAAKGQTRQSYINSLIAEQLTGYAEDNMASTPAMQRGVELEPRARAWYEMTTGHKVQQVGFVYKDGQKDCGCSPDGLCEDRGLEIKCPMHRGMIKTLLGGKVPTDYMAQIQFGIFVTGLARWDFCLFSPEPQLPSVVWTVEPDAAIQDAFKEHVPLLIKEVTEGVEKIRAIE